MQLTCSFRTVPRIGRPVPRAQSTQVEWILIVAEDKLDKPSRVIAVIGGLEIHFAVRFEDDCAEGRTLFPEVILIEAVQPSRKE